MHFRKILLALAIVCAPATALAQSGTPEEQAACRPDVRRFCKAVPADGDSSAFLACLENNRDQLSKKCLAVLIDHGR